MHTLDKSLKINCNIRYMSSRLNYICEIGLHNDFYNLEKAMSIEVIT